MHEVLPPASRRHAEQGRPDEAGLELVRHAEALARADPGAARRWGTRLIDNPLSDPVLRGCARWAAGVTSYLAGDTTTARDSLEEGASILERAGRPDLADRARLLLVDLHGERQELARARRLAGRLQTRFMRRGDHERAAAALINLACAEDASDNIDRARELWRRARGSLAPGSFRRLMAEANLANVAILEGRYAEGVATLQEVERQAEQLGLPGLVRHARLNLAEARFAAGHVDRAFQLWNEVLMEALESDDTGVAVVAELDCAMAEAFLGNRQAAARRLPSVLARAREHGLVRELHRAVGLQLLLEAAGGQRGVWAEALRRLGSRTSRRQLDLLLVDAAMLDPSVDPAAVARAGRRLVKAGLRQRGRTGLAWAARRFLERGDARNARRLAREALDGRRVSPWVRMTAHHVLGRLGGPQAMRHLKAAGREADRLHGRLAAVADRQAFLETRGGVYLDLMEALLARGRPEDRRRALDITSRLRTGWLLDELAHRCDRGDDPLILRWQELRRRLASLLAEANGEDEPRMRRSGLKIHSAVGDIEHQLRDLEAELARSWVPASGTANDGLATELLEILPPGDVFVEYFLDRRDLLIFVAAEGRLNVHRQRNAVVELRQLVGSVRFHTDVCTWFKGAHKARSTAALSLRLSRLAEILQVPVPEDPEGHLWIAPHDVLFHIPWPALPGPGGAPLVDRTVFSLVPGAASGLVLFQDRPRPPRSAAVSGSPSPDLPMIELELAELESTIPGARVVQAAGRHEFLELLGQNELVHLAGHAVFLDGLPIASGLRMNGDYVSVHDLAATRMAARFVSFGVCSGLRVAPAEGDRYAGFLLALMGGGVRTVAGPVVPVEDHVAYTFDLNLHRSLAGTKDPSRAYQTAIAAVRDLDPCPGVWGNFHLYGDHRPWTNA